MGRRYVDREEAATLAGRSGRTVYRWIADGKLKPVDTAGELFDVDEVMRLERDVKRGRPRGTARHA